MKQCIKTLLAVLIVSGLVPVAEANASTLKSTVDDRAHLEGHGYSQRGNTETFIISPEDRTGKLTPRVECYFKRLIEAGIGVFTFSATYKIDAANNTTIFQLLSHFPGTSDVHRPSLFITVFPGDDGATWHIHQSNSIKTPLLATVAKTDTFSVKLQMDGTRLHLWINGKHVLSDTFSAESKAASMRYGAYHHGKGVATVHVTNAKFQLDTAAKLSEPIPQAASSPPSRARVEAKKE